MVSFRGLKPRTENAARKFSNAIRANADGRKLYNAVRQGDSVSKITRDFRNLGYRVSEKTIYANIFNRYSSKTVANFFDRTKAKYGQRSSFNASLIERLTGNDSVKVRVRGTTARGQVYNFDTFVNVGDGQSLNDILEQLEEIYSEDNETNKSPLQNIQFR